MAELFDNIDDVPDFAFRSQDVLAKGMYHRLFPPNVEIFPQINDVYELALAFYESQLLSNEELLDNGAYFIRIDKKYTRHFHMCAGDSVRLPSTSSSRLKSFFKDNQFRTGYATHGLFPYRGKFHPQMIKALMNIMGLKPGDTVLDPMMGSGTVPIEACLMGVKSIGLDASPFCRFMAQIKYQSLTLPRRHIHTALIDADRIFDHFVNKIGHPRQNLAKMDSGQFKSEPPDDTLFQMRGFGQFSEISESVRSNIYNFLTLAYLDSAGYAERSKIKAPIEQFRSILERYVFVVEKIQQVMEYCKLKIEDAEIMEGDARSLPLIDESIDGILFSPPYSFAIDYLENDAFHLNVMGIKPSELCDKMIGLRGRTIRQKFEFYVQDMDQVLSECTRVLKYNRFCTVIIGTNDNQLSRALNVNKDEVIGLHQIIVEKGSAHGLSHVRSLRRRITGIANTMRDEYIVILQKRKIPFLRTKSVQ